MGYVYIFENEWMPRIVKIGVTNNLEQRLKESAHDTFVPCGFTCFYAVKTNTTNIEKEKLEDFVHLMFESFRVNKRREFFEISCTKAQKMLQGLIDIGLATEVDKAEVDRLSEDVAKELEKSGVEEIIRKNPRTTFKMLNIESGSELVFFKDDTKICKVVGEANMVEYENNISTISSLAEKLLGRNSNGFASFKYKEKLLTDIRKELENDA
jgi:hypothetical protein